MKNKIKGLECPGAIGQPGKKGKLTEISLKVCDLCKEKISLGEAISFNPRKKETYHIACADMESLKRKKIKELEMASRIIRGK